MVNISQLEGVCCDLPLLISLEHEEDGVSTLAFCCCRYHTSLWRRVMANSKSGRSYPWLMHRYVMKSFGEYISVKSTKGLGIVTTTHTTQITSQILIITKVQIN